MKRVEFYLPWFIGVSCEILSTDGSNISRFFDTQPEGREIQCDSGRVLLRQHTFNTVL